MMKIKKQCVNRTKRQQKAALVGALTQHYENKYQTKCNNIHAVCGSFLYTQYLSSRSSATDVKAI